MRDFKKDKIPALKNEIAESLSLFLKRPGDFYLEIGCGVGLHPILFSKENPDSNLVAIERTEEKFHKFWGRYINHNKPAQLLPLHADAISVVTHGIPANSLKKIFILYPNPEPGNKNQRWINMPFMSELISKLSELGEIEIRTNIADYADEIKAEYQKYPLILKSFRKIEADEKLKTHFERKYIQRGENCFEIILGVKKSE